MLLERRAKRNLSDLYVNNQTKCNATLDLVDLQLGVAGLPPNNVDSALKLAEEALLINGCYKRAASQISVAIGLGAGTYSPIEREKLRREWHERSFHALPWQAQRILDRLRIKGSDRDRSGLPHTLDAQRI